MLGGAISVGADLSWEEEQIILWGVSIQISAQFIYFFWGGVDFC